MDLNRLTTSDKVILGSAIAFLIFMFVPWYGVGDFGSRTGWDYFLFGIIPLILAIVMAAQVAITAFSPSTRLPDLPITWGQVHLAAGVLAALLVLLKLLLGDDVSGFGFEFELDRKIGIFLATLAAIGLAVGGFLKFQEERGGATATGTTGTTPPTPF